MNTIVYLTKEQVYEAVGEYAKKLAGKKRGKTPVISIYTTDGAIADAEVEIQKISRTPKKKS